MRERARQRPITPLMAWANTIESIDKTEVLIRDLIERELAPLKPAPRVRLIEVESILHRLMRGITSIRTKAFKDAFRYLRGRLGNQLIMGRSLAFWAQVFLQDDLMGIDNAIRTGLIAGLDSTDIARKVVGSMSLNGVDGVTEFTRHKIARLGCAAMRRGDRK